MAKISRHIRKNPVLLVVIVTAVAVVATGTALLQMYRATFQQQQTMLLETVSTQSRLIESATRFDATTTLKQVQDAYRSRPGEEAFANLLVGRRVGRNIVFLSGTGIEGPLPEPVQFDGERSRAMQQALLGYTGTMVDTDYRGTKVLAAHQPLTALQAGLVARVELARLRAPFIRAAGVTGALAVLAILLGAFFQFKVSGTLVRPLRDNEHKFRLLLNSTGEGVYGIDMDGRCTFANSACARLLGYTHTDDLLGRNMHNLIHHTRADGHPYPVENCRIYQSFKSGDGTHVEDEVLWRADGTGFPAEYRSQPVMDNGQMVGAVVTFTDITHKTEMDEKLRKHAELLNEAQKIAGLGSWEWNIQSGAMHWSEQLHRIAGTAADQFLPTYDGFLAGIHREDRVRVDQTMRTAVQAGEAYAIDHRIVLPDGTVRTVQQQGKPYRDASGKRSRMVGTIHDITARKQLETDLTQARDSLEARVRERTEELAVAKESAERANRAKSEFLSSMSHELRTPLNAVLGFGQLLESDTESPLTGIQKDNLKEILKAGEHLLNLITEVLDLSRIEAGQVEVNIKPTPLAHAFEESLSLVGPLARRHGVTITGSAQRQCSQSVLADPTHLKQILVNLLSNAIKYNRPNGNVDLDCTPSTDGRITISVIDTGYGIAAARQPGLFQPFNRLGAENGEIEGCGIGLSITKRLVESMGGKIGFESSEGVGSQFYVTLPRATDVATAPPLIALGGSKKIPALSGNRYQVLYIEDNEANLSLVQHILAQREDIDLFTETLAIPGLRTARALRPDLILLDINLPDMNGMDVLKQLRECTDTRDIPVVAVSANAFPADVEAATRSGFRAYITKPIHVPTFLSTIHAALGGINPSEKLSDMPQTTATHGQAAA